MQPAVHIPVTGFPAFSISRTTACIRFTVHIVNSNCCAISSPNSTVRERSKSSLILSSVAQRTDSINFLGMTRLMVSPNALRARKYVSHISFRTLPNSSAVLQARTDRSVLSKFSVIWRSKLSSVRVMTRVSPEVVRSSAPRLPDSKGWLILVGISNHAEFVLDNLPFCALDANTITGKKLFTSPCVVSPTGPGWQPWRFLFFFPVKPILRALCRQQGRPCERLPVACSEWVSRKAQPEPFEKHARLGPCCTSCG
jgi:hypothetical protein